MAVQRYTAEDPCPICQGHEKLPQGQGIRCWGVDCGDGWCLCTREGGGTKAKFHDDANAWSHRREGPCPCGIVHKDSEEWLAKQTGLRSSTSSEASKVKPAEDNVHQIGEAKGARLVETYDYLALDGSLLYQVCRMEPKSFRQRRKHPKTGEWIWKMKATEGLPEQPTTLYQIPELFAALAAGDDVWIVEGEKDVDACRAKMMVATCNTGGEGKWRDQLSEPFAKIQPGAEIVIVQDIDPEFDKDGKPHRRGQKHARAIFDSLALVVPEGTPVRIVEALKGKDASDHFDAGYGPREFALVWPMSSELLKTTPGIFKKNILRQALVMTDGALQLASAGETAEQPPHFRSPLKGDNILGHLQGVVTIAGAPSSGKSYFAIACGIDNALNEAHPWDVFYLNCEMGPDYVIDRSVRSVASNDLTAYECQSELHRRDAVGWAKDAKIPRRFTRVDVGLGVTMEEVIEFLAESVTDTPTLVILDSISSFVDNMEEVQGDSFGMSNLRTVQKYACAVRRLTKGHISWVILSELNKEGRAKGRSLDHRSDLAMSMSPDPDVGHIKHIRVTKSWFGPTGPLGEFVLWPDISRLVKVAPDD